MRKNLHYALLLLIILVFAACSGNKSGNNEPGTIALSSDLENICWMNQHTLCKTVVHSGKFSSKLDSVNQFSFGFSNSFNNLSDTLPGSVDVSCWIYYPQIKIKSSIVISIDSVGKNIYWKGFPLNDSIKAANQWQEVKVTFEIPKKVMPTDNVKIYVWNNDKRTFYMDDLKLLFHKE
ncbi:MAG: hypothetical protein WCL06_13045 [Bacteroidota bacterium]